MLVKCQLCNERMGQISEKHLMSKHHMTFAIYKRKFPEAQTITQETRDKISVGVSTPERAEAISKALTGRVITWGDKISAVKKGQPNAIAGWNRGLTKETNEIVAKMAANPERKEKIRQAMIGRDTSGWVEKMRQTRIKQYQDPEFLKRMMTHFQNEKTKPEIRTGQILDKNFPKQWLYVGDGSVPIKGKSPDFIHITVTAIVEEFGRHWHTEEEAITRTKFFENLGIATIIIWDNELVDERVLVNRVNEKINTFNFPSVETLHGTSNSGNCN